MMELLVNHKWVSINPENTRKGDIVRIAGEYVYIVEKDPKSNNGLLSLSQGRKIE